MNRSLGFGPLRFAPQPDARDATRGWQLGSFREKQLLAVGDWLLAGRGLGSFRIIGVVGLVKLGSFRIFGVVGD